MKPKIPKQFKFVLIMAQLSPSLFFCDWGKTKMRPLTYNHHSSSSKYLSSISTMYVLLITSHFSLRFTKIVIFYIQLSSLF